MKPAVLCITRNLLSTQGIPLSDAYGIYPFNLSKVPEDQFHFINRNIVDSSHPAHFDIGCLLPQILAYCIIKCGDEVLTYSRKKGAEERLHGSLSLGFGGHVDIEDYNNISNASFMLTILEAANRELKEELDIPIIFDPNQFTAIIVDQTNPVGAVHVGLPTIIIMNSKEGINPNPNEVYEPKWQTLEQIKNELEFYENWSRLVIEQLL